MNKIVVISAVWCPSCLLLKKDLKRLQEEYKDLLVETLDYDFDEDKVKEFDIGNKLPVIISFNNNKEVKRLIGEKSYEEILSFLKESDVV